MNEAVRVDIGNITSDIPAVTHYFGGLVRLAEVPLHYVRTFDEQHAGLIQWEVFKCFGVYNLGRDARNGPTHRAFFHIDRRALRSAWRHVDRNQRRELRRAITFHWSNTEL